MPELAASARRFLEGLIASLDQRLDPAVVERLKASIAGSGEQVAGWAAGALRTLVTGSLAFANLLSLLLITPIVAFYLLRDWDRLVAQIDGLLPRPALDTVRGEVGKVDSILAGFVRGQATVCLVLAIFYAVGLTLAGLEFGLIIGLLAGALSFIPFIGAGIGGLASIGLAIFQFGLADPVRIGIVAGIFILGQALEGNFLTPRLVGDRVGLHPVWVIFALLAGGVLAGFVGVLLAVPVAAVIGVLVRFLIGQYLDSDLYRGGTSQAEDEEQ